MTASGGTPWWRSEAFKVGLALTVISAVLGLVVTWFASERSSGGGGSQPPAAAPVATATSAAAQATAAPTSDDPAPPTPAAERTTRAQAPAPTKARTTPPEDDAAPQPPKVRYLADLDPIGGLGNWKSTGAAQMRQRTYGNSVVFSPNYFNSTKLDLTYNVPLGMRYFDATVGLDDRTGVDSSVFFQVELDGSPADSGFTLGVDGTKQLHMPLGGAQRLTIRIEVLKRGPDAVNADLHAVWGDARFTVR